MTGACSWDAPGADRYTGTVPAAIVAYGLPIATQSALIEAFERRQFTDSVVIDRDTIRGRSHDYAPDIRAMHFGDRGRICGTVTRTGWSAEHVETALVICAGGECIAWPSACGNLFRLTRIDRSEAVGDRPVVAVGDEPVEPLSALTIAGPLAPSWPVGVPMGQPAKDDGTGGTAFIPTVWPGFQAAPLQLSPVFVPGLRGSPAPVPSVPEPETYALLLAGLAALGVAMWTKKP